MNKQDKENVKWKKRKKKLR